MMSARSDRPRLGPGVSILLFGILLLVHAPRLPAQARATVQVSAQVVAVQPSADGLQAAQAMARGDGGPSRQRARLASVRRITSPARFSPGFVTAALPAKVPPSGNPTTIVEIQFLRN